MEKEAGETHTELSTTRHLANSGTSLKPGAQPGDSEVGDLPQNPSLPLYCLVSQCPSDSKDDLNFVL